MRDVTLGLNKGGGLLEKEVTLTFKKKSYVVSYEVEQLAHMITSLSYEYFHTIF